MNINESLVGRVALVTGAGSGIGKASALLLAETGARVAALGRTKNELLKVVDEMNEKGGEAIPLIADVQKPSEVEQGIQEISRKWGRLDVVVANAGVNGVWAPLDELDPQEWDQTQNINLKGTFLTVKYALPLLKRQGGSVIVVSSINGNRIFTSAGATAYSCSKAGQVAFTKMSALELSKYGIRVNVICPGSIETEIGDNTCTRHVEKAKIPVEYPEREDSFDSWPRRQSRAGGTSGVVFEFRSVESHFRNGSLH